MATTSRWCCASCLASCGSSMHGGGRTGYSRCHCLHGSALDRAANLKLSTKNSNGNLNEKLWSWLPLPPSLMYCVKLTLWFVVKKLCLSCSGICGTAHLSCQKAFQHFQVSLCKFTLYEHNHVFLIKSFMVVFGTK